MGGTSSQSRIDLEKIWWHQLTESYSEGQEPGLEVPDGAFLFVFTHRLDEAHIMFRAHQPRAGPEGFKPSYIRGTEAVSLTTDLNLII